jgi:hypothetical protein
MATTYFGPQTDSATDNDSVAAINAPVAAYACPGSGNQTVVELSFLYGSGKLLIGIYNSSGTTLICSGTASVSVTGSSLSWQGHLGAANITPNPATLVGGTSYLIVAAYGGSISIHYGYDSPGGNPAWYSNADYTTSGLPASISPTGNNSELVCIRCGVTPAVGGGMNQVQEAAWWRNPYAKYFDMNAGNWRKQNGIYVKG